MRIPVLLRFLQLDVGLPMLRPVNGYLFLKQYADKPVRDVPAVHRRSSMRLNATCNEPFAQRKAEDHEKA